jgi:hypothetical protein
MQKKFTWMDGLVLVAWLLPLLYLVSVYPSLGPTLPLHFNMQGKPDSYGSKAEFVGVILFLNGISLGIMLLFRFLPRIDPKKTAKYSGGVFSRIGHAVVLLLAVIAWAIIYTATHGRFIFQEKFMYVLLGLFFAYLGNLMNNVKPNYFFGIRTPWALENPEVWRKTHQLAGRLWLPGGLLLAVLAFIVPVAMMHFVFVAVVIVLAIVPVTFSYLYYRKISQ